LFGTQERKKKRKKEERERERREREREREINQMGFNKALFFLVSVYACV
jgi:hypothetical protein